MGWFDDDEEPFSSHFKKLELAIKNKENIFFLFLFYLNFIFLMFFY